MKKSRFTEVQVVQALQKHESGVTTGVIWREMGIAPATFYKKKAKCEGVDVSDLQKQKTLEEEHSRLKKMYADLAMDNQLLRDLFSKNTLGSATKRQIAVNHSWSVDLMSDSIMGTANSEPSMS